MAQTLELEDYQKKAARFVIQIRRCMLALCPGLGKTVSVLAAFRTLRKHGMASKMLVVAPLNPAKMVWRQEASKWEPFADMDVRLLHGSGREAAAHSDADIHVINYESLNWLYDQFDECPYDVIVLDESTYFKSPQSKRRKAILPWTWAVPYVVELTGTPSPRSLEDLWAQIHILDGGRALGRYVTHFRDRYCYPKHKRGHVVYEWGFKEGAEESIHAAVAPRVLRMSAEDYLDLPDYVFRDIDVELPPKAMRQYRSMEKEMFAELDNGDESIALSAGSARGRCHQMVGGGLYKDDREGEDYWHLHNAKTDALKVLLESLQGQPVIIAIQFRHERERVAQAVKSITGKEPPAVVSGSTVDTAVLQEEWNAGQHPAVIVHPASLSHGANLQNAGVGIVWYSMTDNLEHYDQLNRRLRRRGRTSPVMVWHIKAVNTVDEAIISRGGEKSQTQQTLLDALHSYRHDVCSCI
ncbi:DEAD/DEAH box helicase [Kushneria phosphatilytica]|uniref:DEAD/DEAH box helicase n=1 Tax=Kushneria phosphatilytica TaxID=657387 RepID=A0A1S1NX59_9GAMM|nr:DEAD/DEAH box helicase [Kushneria phosphatilytica]OHV12150.1 hypothetical protein BH688_05715 [Kushneria phosphatilytica]QEL11343.1 DEAD/DEAH box helicase [Kushneria phosphatilytica]